jgi:hypothetical protein
MAWGGGGGTQRLNGRRAIGGEDMRWLRFAGLKLVSVKWDSKHAADLYSKGVPLALSHNHKHSLPILFVDFPLENSLGCLAVSGR